MNKFASKALARSVVKQYQLRKAKTPAERQFLANLTARIELLLRNEATPQTVQACVGDRVRVADYSAGPNATLREGIISSFSADSEQAKVVTAVGRRWVYRLYLEVLPRTADFIPNGRSILLIKSEEWQS